MNLNVSDTIVPKSDQLNADDLITGPVTVQVTGVKRGDKEQPIAIEIAGHRPYKPCKSMRRVLIYAWTEDASKWIGKRMTLYRDPEVLWAGVKVGGIRISHLSGIDKPLDISLTVTRGKKANCTVKPLPKDDSAGAQKAQPAPAPDQPYPDDAFNVNLPKWIEAVRADKLTVEQIIEKAGQRGKLTEDQLRRIKAINAQTPAEYMGMDGPPPEGEILY